MTVNKSEEWGKKMDKIWDNLLWPQVSFHVTKHKRVF